MDSKKYVNNGIQNGQEIQFLLSEEMNGPKGVPSGKMITDSDEVSFVYLFEDQDIYEPIHFTQAVWPLMVKALQEKAEPMLVWQDKAVPLKGFLDELQMLIYNIEGNGNYGEEFTSAVEEAFSVILQSAE
ncbi:hypothetical protein [Sporosarcina sp. HYO08]|uniref:UPF0738 family protein n=1 Tax=Sporosarcina sp. HYO08 TaxID=1759557 RepID=UPI0020A54D97|nr:hypothetical protein [Sporosarcina sp. HYO08]